MKALHCALLAIGVLGCTSAVPGVSPAATIAPATAVPSPSAADPSPTRVESPPAETATAEPPAFPILPDEPWIVYEGWVDEKQSVGNKLIRPDGSDDHWATPDAPIAVGNQAGDGWQLHPDWSPDGQQMVFVVDEWPDTDGHRDLWIANADGTGTREIFDCQSPCDAAEFPAWSKDGKSIMFVTWDVVGDVVDGSKLRAIEMSSGEVTILAETHGGDYFAYPRWSPDGERVVTQIEHWSDDSTESTMIGSSVAVVDLGETPPTVTMLTDPGDWATYPDWHPTQDLIAYTAGSGGAVDNGKSDLYTMTADGSEQTLIHSAFEQSLHPTWLPDGTRIMFILVRPGDISSAVMSTIKPDGTDLGWATSDGPHFGTHPRLRPLKD